MRIYDWRQFPPRTTRMLTKISTCINGVLLWIASIGDVPLDRLLIDLTTINFRSKYLNFATKQQITYVKRFAAGWYVIHVIYDNGKETGLSYSTGREYHRV